VKWGGGKGWQGSIFNDDNLGYYWIEMKREVTDKERDYLQKHYPDLNDAEMEELIERISKIYTGEMIPYYIMKYGFYEGHTSWRADPVAIAFIFDLKSIEDINESLDNEIFKFLTKHFTDK